MYVRNVLRFALSSIYILHMLFMLQGSTSGVYKDVAQFIDDEDSYPGPFDRLKQARGMGSLERFLLSDI